MTLFIYGNKTQHHGGTQKVIKDNNLDKSVKVCRLYSYDQGKYYNWRHASF